MSLLSSFRWITFLEGISYIVLLFVAMPLKYLAGYPLAVKITGMAHGVLFVAFGILLLLTAIKFKWKWTLSLSIFISSLIPFASFFIDRTIVSSSSPSPASKD